MLFSLLGPTCYHVAVKTGKDTTAGTDANVFLIIYGKNGRTTTHLLDNPNTNDFERGTISEFTVRNVCFRFEKPKITEIDSFVGINYFISSRSWIWTLVKSNESKFGMIIQVLVLLGYLIP